MSAAARPRWSAAVLWVAAPPLLALSAYRPFAPSAGQAQALPTELPGYRLAEDRRIRPEEYELLGTDDAVWRVYRDDGGHALYVVAVFHGHNWKSVHPPRICLEGSGMAIQAEGEHAIGLPGQPGAAAGRILAHSRSEGRDYLSLYVYGAPDLLTPSYLGFFWHHAPRAVLRRPTRGFLLRVETFVGDGGVEAAEERCRDFTVKILPAARALLR